MFLRRLHNIKPVRSQLPGHARPIVTRAYVVNGGNEEIRKNKLLQLSDEDQFSMYGFYKNKNEDAIVFGTDHNDFKGMTFEKAKKIAGSKELGADLSITTFGKEPRFGVVSLEPQEEKKINSNDQTVSLAKGFISPFGHLYLLFSQSDNPKNCKPLNKCNCAVRIKY